MPESYFDQDTTDKLTGLRDRAMHERRPELLDDFSTERFEKNLIQTWRSAAALVYRNWLTYLCARKKRKPADRQNRNDVSREAELVPESHFAAAD
jgi:homoserine trans-succinylase